MRKLIYVLPICLIVAALGAGAFWYIGNRAPAGAAQAAASAQVVAADVASTTGATDATSSRPVPAQCGQPAGAVCVEYRSEQYHFSVFYSSQKQVQVYDEGGDASTFVFENFDNVHGFQIFVVPYSGTQVSEQRFEEDEPSGVRQDVQNVTVDGATGAAFYSTDPDLGDTYEVWFIHGGYLYEVTTLKSLAPQMQERLQTWEWI